MKMKWDNSKEAEILRFKYPFGDKDKDNVPNIIDCQPFNPDKDGIREFLTSVGQRVTGAVSTATTAVKTRMAAVKPAIKRYAEIASKPSSLSGLYIHEIRKKHKEPKPAEKSIVSGYETVFVPARTHFKMVSETMRKPEQFYETKVIEPVTTTIMGKPKISPEVISWEQKWKPYIKEGKFTGTEMQYQQYLEGLNKYYKKTGENQYVLREQYVIKPNLLRQTAAGIAAGALYLPIWRFSVGRVATGAIAEPRAFPKKAISYAKGIMGLAKEQPGYFAGSLIGMGIVGSPRLRTYAERLSPLYVSPKRITATPVLEEKMPSTGRVPVSTSPETLKTLMEEPTFKLTGKAEEVWHAAPKRMEEIIPGEGQILIEPEKSGSATKGLYVGYAAYPKFAVGSIIEAPRRVKTPTEPTLYSIITRGIEIPKEAKVTKGEIIAARKILGGRAVPGSDIVGFAKYKKYVEQIAPKGYAYISPEATAKLPWRGYLEVESVIPPFSMLKEPLTSRVFTRFTYVKVPKYKFTRAGRRLFKGFEKEWQKKFKEAKTEPERVRLRTEYEKTEAKLLKELKEKGELRQRGYEPVKLSVRRLLSSELSKEEIKKATEPLGGLKGKLERTPKIEVREFRAGEIMWRAPRRFYGYPIRVPRITAVTRTTRRTTEQIRRASEPLRLPEQRTTTRQRKGREPERGRQRYRPPEKGRRPPERGRKRERYPPREERPPRERYPPERIPPVRTPLTITPRRLPKLTTTEQKPKKRYRKQKKEWEKYYRIAPIAKPEEILSGSLKLLGGRR